MTYPTRRSRQARVHAAARGYTLIELCAAMLIVAILATSAMSVFQSQVLKSHRTEARNALLDIAGREQQLYSTTNAYSTKPSDIGYGTPGAAFPMTVGSGYYTVNVTVTLATVAVPATFTLTATASGAQVKDTDCVTYTVTSTGAQASVNAAGAPTSTCW